MTLWKLMVQLVAHVALTLQWNVWTATQCAPDAGRTRTFIMSAAPDATGWQYTERALSVTAATQWFVESTTPESSVMRWSMLTTFGWPPHLAPHTLPQREIFSVRDADGAIHRWNIAWRAAATPLDGDAMCVTAIGDITEDADAPIGAMRCCIAHDRDAHTFCRWLSGDMEITPHCHLTFVTVQS